MKIKIATILILILLNDSSVSTRNASAPSLSGRAISMSRFLNNFISMGSSIQENFYAARSKLLQAEIDLMTGAHTTLDEIESRVNNLFMKYKRDELNLGKNNTDLNAGGLHFFKAKPIIERSKIFRFLRKMPKGAILHIHNTASVSSTWVVRNISYMPGLMRCTNKNGISILTFRKAEKHNCASSYVSVSKERRESYNSSIYDFYFEKLINLHTSKPELDYPFGNQVWDKFQNMFLTISDALEYIYAFRIYHWQMLKEMYDDNIMYAEVRSTISELYDINGRVYKRERTIKELINVVNKFRLEYPRFMGIKVIVTEQRNKSNEKISQKFLLFQELQSKFPDFIVGFDFVGQEDKGRPLIEFAELLRRSPQTTYFFHAGETNNFGTSTDINLMDAILLNTKRIGHGYMLMKHPLLRQILKTRQIAVEVCPISNQILHLTADLRNHPGGIFLSENIPMVISNDDPGFWDANGLSYDFYYAIMSFAAEGSGLNVLKTLVLNSLKYATLSSSESNKALSQWQRDYGNFLNDVLKGKVF